MTSDRRIEAIRRLVSEGDPRAVLEILDEASRLSHNDAILRVLVRSFGYLAAPEAFDRALPFLQHPSKAVMGSAVKSLMTLDVERATGWIVGVLRHSDAERILMIMKYFMER